MRAVMELTWKIDQNIVSYLLGAVHKLRNAIFELFDPLPLLVTHFTHAVR